jgi:hypothetical protein
MSRVIFFLENIAPGLYALCAIGLIFAAYQFMSSQHDLRIAEFELRREFARKKQANAITMFLGMIEVALAILAISAIIAPTMREDIASGLYGNAPIVQPTSMPFYTSTPGGSGLVVGLDGSAVPGGVGSISDLFLTVTAQAQSGSGPQLLITATASPTFVGTINPDMPPAKGCDTADATLQIPANGQVIFDSIEVHGTANTTNFAMYKFELSGPSTGNVFVPYGGDKISPVLQPGVLGQLALNAFQPGFYEFRLAVFDNTNTLKASCTVNVEVRYRPPTATPPGGAP